MASLLTRVNHFAAMLNDKPKVVPSGIVVKITGLIIEASGCSAPIGSYCRVVCNQQTSFLVQVVGFANNILYLMPTDDLHGAAPGAKVFALNSYPKAPVTNNLLGRVLDGNGQPIDGKGPIVTDEYRDIKSKPINPLTRTKINHPLDVGVRAINALLTVGKGQRIGLLAGSGVGKSNLLGMMTKFSSADVVVIGLIGERGREVKEFIENILGAQGMKKAVVIASPADSPPLQRITGAQIVHTIAEHFRDQGLQVLLLFDSLTRYAQAQRELGLSLGEPPTTKGYPPSVFFKIPQLIERAGTGGQRGGSITGFYTVLAEGDDTNDPIVDAARAILDGHIVLSRKLAEIGHFPAIDLATSISRIMPDVVTTEHISQALKFKKIYAKYRDNEDLINIGAYEKGQDSEIDFAINKKVEIDDFLTQNMNESFNLNDSIENLNQILAQNQIQPVDDNARE